MGIVTQGRRPSMATLTGWQKGLSSHQKSETQTSYHESRNYLTAQREGREMTGSLKCELADTMRRIVVGLSRTKLDKRGMLRTKHWKSQRWAAGHHRRIEVVGSFITLNR